MRRRSASAASTSERRARNPSTSNRSRRRAITSEAAIATVRNTSCAGPRNRAKGSSSTAAAARARHHAPATITEAIGGDMSVDSTRLESDRASAGRTHAHDHATEPGATSEARASTADRRDHDRHAAREHHGEPRDGRRAHRLEHRVGPRAVGGRDAGERHDRRDHEEQQRPVGVGRGPDRREQRDGGRGGEPWQPQRGRRRHDARHIGWHAHTGARAVEPGDAGLGRQAIGAADRASPVIERSTISGARRPRAAGPVGSTAGVWTGGSCAARGRGWPGATRLGRAR